MIKISISIHAKYLFLIAFVLKNISVTHLKRVASNKMCLDVNANYPYQLGLYTAASNQVP